MAKKPVKPPKRQPMSAATERALKLVAKGWTRYAAAKHEGLALSTVYRSVKRIEDAAANEVKARRKA